MYAITRTTVGFRNPTSTGFWSQTVFKEELVQALKDEAFLIEAMFYHYYKLSLDEQAAIIKQYADHLEGE